MSETENGRNRRKRERLSLSLPIHIQCRETLNDKWETVTRLIDITPFGAGFALSRSIDIGRLLLLTIPMPRQLRCYDHLEPQYNVWGLVRHVRKKTDEETNTVNYSIGVAFVGKHPPASYGEDPSKLYEVVEPDAIGFWAVREVAPQGSEGIDYKVELRRQTRYQIPMSVTIEIFNERGETIASEMTTTENISLAGASVFTSLEVERGRFVRLSSDQYDITIVALVRARKTGKDGIARLHLEFIDRQFPLEMFD